LKGRTVWNKPSIKKTDVYKLIVKLGGKARWTHLKAHLKELGWGPTTLKQTLDEMVKEGSVFKEAIAGSKGPEIWYKLSKSKVDFWILLYQGDEIIRESAFFEPLTLEKVAEALREKVEAFEEGERRGFIANFLQDLVEKAAGAYKASIYRGAYDFLYKQPGAATHVDASLDILKGLALEIMQIFQEFPDAGKQVVTVMLEGEMALTGSAEDGVGN